MLFAQLRVHLLDKGLRVTVMAVDGLDDIIPMHWKELPCPQITNLRSTNFVHFINTCFPWIFTTKWFLLFCRNQTRMGKGWTPVVINWKIYSSTGPFGTYERGLWDNHLQTHDNPPLIGDKLNADCCPCPSSKRKLKKTKDETIHNLWEPWWLNENTSLGNY